MNDIMSEQEVRPVFKKDILNILIGSLIGIIPGVFLWFVMIYLQSVAGIVGFFITAGALISYKFFAKNIKTYGVVICIAICVVCVFSLDTCISAYTLHKEYVSKTSQAEIEKTRVEFVESYSATSKDSLDQFLKKNNISSLEDTNGLDKFVKQTVDEAFAESYCITTLPTTYTKSFKSLFQTLSHNRLIHFSRYYIANLISSISFSFLAFVMITNSRFFNKFNINCYDEDDY